MLTGKFALVTGSTSGIGWGIAQALAKCGVLTMLHGLEKETQIEDKIETITKLQGGKCPPYSNLNLSEESNCCLLIEKATEYFGKIDILVNNAGRQFTSPAQYFPLEEWELIMKVNLNAPFFLSRTVLPQMYSRGWGRLIHTGSVHSLVASLDKSAYVASKHGLYGLSKVIALETAGSGITSNVICPGFTITPLVQKQIDDYAKLRNTSSLFASMHFLHEKQPSEVFVTTEQLGGLIVFLCSEDADQVTGAAFSMDGGWTAV